MNTRETSLRRVGNQEGSEYKIQRGILCNVCLIAGIFGGQREHDNNNSDTASARESHVMHVAQQLSEFLPSVSSQQQRSRLHTPYSRTRMATNPASDVDFWGDSIHPSQPHSSDSEPDDYDNAYPRDAHEDTCHVADEDDARPQRRRHRAPSASGSTSSEPDSDGDSEQDYSFPTSVSATPTLIADEVLPPGTGQAIQNLDDVIRSINHALHLKALPPSSIPPTAAQIHKYLAQSGEKVVDAVRKSLFDGGTQVLVFPKLGQRGNYRQQLSPSRTPSRPCLWFLFFPVRLCDGDRS